jgi:Phage integrase family
MTPGICFSAGRSTTRTSNPFALSASGFARSVRQLLAGTSSHPRPTKRFRSSEARASACSTLGHSSARINSSPMRNPSVKPAGLSVSSQRITSTKPVNVHTAYGSSASSFEATPSPARATGIVSGRWGSLGQRLVQGLVLRAARSAGLRNVGVHVLRHTFCSHLAMRGRTPGAIQKLAGHRDLVTTQRYMHPSPAAVESAIRLLDQRTPPPHDGDIVETANAAVEKGA